MGFGVCSLIRYWDPTKFAIGRRLTIWTLKQNAREMWPKVLYLIIQTCLSEFRETLSYTLRKHDLYKVDFC